MKYPRNSRILCIDDEPVPCHIHTICMSRADRYLQKTSSLPRRLFHYQAMSWTKKKPQDLVIDVPLSGVQCIGLFCSVGNLSFDIIIKVEVDGRHCKRILEQLRGGGSLVGIGDKASVQEALSFLRDRVRNRWMCVVASDLFEQMKEKKTVRTIGNRVAQTTKKELSPQIEYIP